jgi:hypothetical protein
MCCNRNPHIEILEVREFRIPLHMADRRGEFRPTPRHIEVLIETLRAVPPMHMKLLHNGGYIRASSRNCPPAAGGGNDPDAPWIRLSAASFDQSYNRNANATLLHEFGHIVEFRYDAMDNLFADYPALYRTLLDTAHQGATQGPAEQFSDCYMIYIITQIMDRAYIHRAQPDAYEGEGAHRRFEALLNTHAFAGWHGPLSELRRQA